MTHHCYEAKWAAAGRWCWDRGGRGASACRHGGSVGRNAGSSGAVTCHRLTKMISAAANDTVTLSWTGYDPPGVEQRSSEENLRN